MIAERLAINSDYLGGLNGLTSVPPIVLGLNGSGHELRDTLPVCHVMLAPLLAGLAVMRSRFGLALAAVRDNERRARALGYDPARLKRERISMLSSAVRYPARADSQLSRGIGIGFLSGESEQVSFQPGHALRRGLTNVQRV